MAETTTQRFQQFTHLAPNEPSQQITENHGRWLLAGYFLATAFAVAAVGSDPLI